MKKYVCCFLLFTTMIACVNHHRIVHQLTTLAGAMMFKEAGLSQTHISRKGLNRLKNLYEDRADRAAYVAHGVGYCATMAEQAGEYVGFDGVAKGCYRRNVSRTKQTATLCCECFSIARIV